MEIDSAIYKWLDSCLTYKKDDFVLVYKDIDLMQTIGSLNVISRHASDFHTGLGFPEYVKRDPSLKSASFHKQQVTKQVLLLTKLFSRNH